MSQVLFGSEIDVLRVNNDVNGNPRYVIHFPRIASYLREQLGDLIKDYDSYALALSASGCRKYHNKQYGGGLLFSSYNVQDELNHIENRVIEYAETFKQNAENAKIQNAIEYLDLNKKLVKAYNFDTLQDMQDIAQHGYSSGVSGFIYYSETVAFWRKHKKALIQHLEHMALSFGEKDMISFIKGFNSSNIKDASYDEIGRVLYGKYNADFDYIYNDLVWAVGEDFAYNISEYIVNELS